MLKEEEDKEKDHDGEQKCEIEILKGSRRLRKNIVIGNIKRK